MTTISRTNQVSHSTVTSGGDGSSGDWDHRLNSLLHDLQESVIPESSRGASEYREYRMTFSTKTNDEPPSTTEEKWVEYGTKNGAGYERTTPQQQQPLRIGGGGLTSSSSTSRSKFESSSSERNVGFSDRFGANAGRTYGIDSGLTTSTTRTPQMEYLTPVNTITELRSGPSSPIGTTSGIEPKVERKEFYSKASYTTLLKGGPDGEYQVETDRDRIMEELLPPRDFPPLQQQQPSPRPAISSSSTSESRREFMESRSGGTSGTVTTGGFRCPAHQLLAQQEQQQRSLTSKEMYSKESLSSRTVQSSPPPKPIEGLKTPPLVRKVLHSSTAAYDKSSYDSRTASSTRTTERIPYEEPAPGTQYYTSRTTRTETREREMSPVRRFPSPLPPGQYSSEPPKHLDELLATFDESYTHTSRITGDGGGPHKSVPYGPGTHQIRNVRIDERVQRNIIDSDAELVQRKTGNGHVESKAVSGPPVFYPQGELFKGEEEMAGKGKAKAKMERQYKAKEKSKQSHKESGGQGAVPVPVCLPVCCAAPCVIQ